MSSTIDVGRPSTQGAAEAGLLPVKQPAPLRRKVAAVVVMVVLGLATSLATLGIASAYHPSLLSPGLLALSFGLRHAVDADHIAAIDNVTRKLMSDGQQPLLVGFWFSLGHSTVVCLACIALAWSSAAIVQASPQFAAYGGLFGASFSSAVLILFGLYNTFTAVNIYRAWSRLRRGGAATPDPNAPTQLETPVRVTHEHDGQARHTHLVTVVARPAGAEGETVVVEGLGCLTQSFCCRALFKSVDKPWKLFPIGFLFGLGFDTATEIALLALAVALPTGSDGVPWPATLVLPFVFTTAMCMVDTFDGLLMLYSYGWASVDVQLQLFFALTLTVTSAVIAGFIGVTQALGIVQEELELTGRGWQPIIGISEHSSAIGGAVVGFFALCLICAVLYARFGMARGPAAKEDAAAADARVGFSDVQDGASTRQDGGESSEAVITPTQGGDVEHNETTTVTSQAAP